VIRPGSQSAFQFIPKMFDWGCGQGCVEADKVLPHRSQQTISVWTSLCARGHCQGETGKGHPPIFCHNVRSTELSRMSLYAVALRFPFTGTKGPNLNHEKQLQPLFHHHHTLQLALCIGAGTVFLASAKPGFICRTARWRSMIHHFRESVSTAPESNGG
jgi:hypothetical protein